MDAQTQNWLRESLVFRINESRVRKVEFATLPADMCMLAAQQVNEVRLNALEAPKEVGWDNIAFEFVLGFVINSSFMEKLSAKFFQKIYGSILSSQLALKVLPKSLFGTAAAKIAAKSTGSIFQAAAGKPHFDALGEAERVLAQELRKYVNLNPATKETLKLYASGINELVAESKNASAIVKAVKDGAKKGPPKKVPELSATDGASVVVMEHFASAARAQRLHIESLHNQYELIARTLPLREETIIQIDQMFDLNAIVDSGKEAFNLDQITSGMRIRLEAMIWAIHLGFSRELKIPDISPNSITDYDVFRPSIDGKIVRYLFTRFGPLVEAYHRQRGDRVSMSERETTTSRANALRNYFWAIGDEFK
ncbi:MAG TPA: hypothetical protein VF928_11910 [Usitatibacteraceae bacterium]